MPDPIVSTGVSLFRFSGISPQVKWAVESEPFGLTVPLSVAIVPRTFVAESVVTVGGKANLNEAILVLRLPPVPIYSSQNQNVVSLAGSTLIRE